MMYNSSPVDSCLLHIMHVKQFRWNTLLRALRTKSFGEIPWAQPAHFVPKRLKMEDEIKKEKISLLLS